MLILFLEVYQELGDPDVIILSILDIMYVLCRPQESYPETFMLIYLLEVCQEWGSLIWVLGVL